MGTGPHLPGCSPQRGCRVLEAHQLETGDSRFKAITRGYGVNKSKFQTAQTMVPKQIYL